MPVRPSLRRRSVPVGLALSAVLALSACSAGDVRPGAAAVVGDGRITTARLAEVVAAALKNPAAEQQLGADREGFQREVLRRLVTAQLLDAAAARLGVGATAGQVDQRIAQFAQQAGGRTQLLDQAAQAGVSADQLTPFVRDLVLREEIGDALTKDVTVPPAELAKAYQDNIAQYDKVHAAHILVPDQATAKKILAEVEADPSRFAPLAAQFSTDTGNKDKGGDLGSAGRGDFVKPFEAALFSAPVGSYFVVQTQFGWHVVHVLAHDVTTPAQATPALRRTLLTDQINQRTTEYLQQEAQRLHIKVSPQFGTWDSSKLLVQPFVSSVSTKVPDETTPDGGAGSGPASGGEAGGGAPAGGAPAGGAPAGGAPAGGAPADPNQPQPAPSN